MRPCPRHGMRAVLVLFLVLAASAAAAGRRDERGGALAAAGAKEDARTALMGPFKIGVNPRNPYYVGFFKKKAVSSWGFAQKRHLFLTVRGMARRCYHAARAYCIAPYSSPSLFSLSLLSLLSVQQQRNNHYVAGNVPQKNDL